MEIVGGALKALISNLAPDGGAHYADSAWVQEELQPLLKALNQKASNNLRMIREADERHNVTLMLVVVMAAILVLMILMIIVCFRSQRHLTSKLTNGIHNIYANIGQRATNEQPSFDL